MSDENKLAYFEQDLKYDKTFYFNTKLDLFKIIMALVGYFIFHIFVFWGHICLSTTHPEEHMWLNVALFIFCNVWIVAMVIYGHFSNVKLARYNFYLEKINNKEQALKEQQARDDQKRLQEEKIAQQAAK